ncbi:polysaccharide deacetylase family protein [Cohnella soli]|uniref:Polysaccharide deacetylase family protein n=1 Tax=Cohnella soli TaxID=425005 RepID=A0ABW0HLT9_9BACL
MKWKTIACLSVACIGVASGFSYQPAKKSRQYYEAHRDIVWEVPMKEKLIALTFDDGPNPRTTPQILDLLAQNEAKATFFVVGKRMERFPDIVRREALEGHEVANHTYSHAYFTKGFSPKKLVEELQLTQAKIDDLTGKHCQWFRPPGGFYDDKVINTVRGQGYTVILWSWHQDTKDWLAPGTDRIVNKVLKNARNGDIVLMHDHVDGSVQTVQALRKILPELRKRGYKMVTVSELLQHRTPKT